MTETAEIYRTGHGEKYSRKQEMAITALLSEPTIEAAAKKAGIGEATLRRWLAEEDFKEQFRQAKRQIVDHAITRLQNASGEAVETLRQVMTDSDAPASARVSAAKTVLEQSVKATELEEAVRRIETLEEIVQRKGEGSSGLKAAAR